MGKSTWFGALMCALVAIICGGVAIEIADYFGFGRWIAIPAALVAGPIAWVAINVKGVMQGARRSFDEVVAWRPDVEAWKTFFIYLGGATCCGLSTALIVLMGLALLDPDLTLTGKVFAFSFISMTLAYFLPPGTKDLREIGLARMKRGNPVSVSVLAVYYAGKIVFYWLPIGVKKAVVFVWDKRAVAKEFVKRAYIYAHAEARTTAFLVTAIGVLVGVFFWSAILCGAIAFTLYIIEREVVAKRLLKIIPVKAD